MGAVNKSKAGSKLNASKSNQAILGGNMNQVKSTGAGLLAMQHKQRSMATIVNKVNIGKAPVMGGSSMVPASKNIITNAVRSPAARNMPVVNIDDDLDRD